MAYQVIPGPQELGLPEKFDKWRPSQRESLELIQRSTKRFIALCKPTGSGKSATNVGAAIRSGVPTCIVTDNKGLQDQYMADFESIGMVDLRGRSNYKCSMRDELTCEDGYAASCPYKGSVMCPSTKAEIKAATSKLVTMNYAKWCANKKYGLGMSHFKQVIFDEGHSAFRALSQSMQIVLHYKEIEDTLRVPFLPERYADDVQNWKNWAASTKLVAEAEMAAAQARISGPGAKASWIRHYTHMRNLVRSLTVLAGARASNWVVDRTDGGYQFDPISPGMYAETALFFRIPRIIITSATLRPKTMFMLGVGMDNFDFVEFDSDFDPSRSPFYYLPTMEVDKYATDLSPLWVRMDQVLSRRRDRKGTIHTISYNRRDEVVNASRFGFHMLINSKGEPTQKMIEDFKEAGPGAILVSPSIGMGYDFPDSECEFQIICKVPFPDTRSKVTKARQDLDKEYGPYQAMQSLIQMPGRGMRHKGDRCENFIFDKHAGWFIPRYKHLASKSFLRCFKPISTLPQPPQALICGNQ